MDQLAGLTEEVRKLALDRFRLLQPHLEDDRPLKAVAMSAGIPFRTAQRWVSLYRQFGLTALAQRRRTDTGQHREMSAKLKEALEGIALQKPPIPVTAISRQARRLAQDLGEEPPSYWVVYRIVAALPRCRVAALPADLVTLAHEGTKAYSNAFELVHRREADRPNAIWQADHTPLDILLVSPDGAAAKPSLTTVIDDHSRAVRCRRGHHHPNHRRELSLVEPSPHPDGADSRNQVFVASDQSCAWKLRVRALSLGSLEEHATLRR